ncbi:MAG: hypothetical protein FJ349_08730 [Sphingomonadales bacterium]|nr:hypothetical protein [Sphingomonadales bacterium]
MKRNSIKIFLFGFLFGFLSTTLFANPDSLFYPKKRTLKSGTYFGLQSGRFYALEYGWELQRKTREDLVHSNTTAVHHGFNASYDFSRLNPILGYDIGFWSRTGNLDLTYGLSAAVRTDLKQLRFGLCPSVGIKVWQLHVQTGMYVLGPFYALDNTTFNSNTFFISARFLLVKHKKTKGAN